MSALANKKVDRILGGMERQDRASLAKAITLIENEALGAETLLSSAYRIRKGAFVTGITGAPGVGKSTLVNALIGTLRAAGRSVGAIAVDPSSPFTGGAILGDRVRLQTSHSLDRGVFFRSIASRGHLGGLSRHTGDVIALMDAFGFDDILVETVGAGQSEVDIMQYAHTVVVALSPGLGDEVQALKAGIMEIGDVFCVNKADLPGAEKTVAEIEMMLSLKDHEEHSWMPPVVRTVATASGHVGIGRLKDEITSHQEYLVSNDLLGLKNRVRSKAVLREYLRLLTVDHILASAARDESLNETLDSLVSGAVGPLEAARSLLKKHHD